MKTVIAILVVLLAAFVVWPYYHVWRLDRAVIRNDRAELSLLVDLKAVQEQLKRRLNKEADSSVGDMSNAFMDWLQDGIQRMGSEAVERMVTLDWVRDQLLSKTDPGQPAGFMDQISYAFFDRPNGFLVRIGGLGEDPVHFLLTMQGTTWRVTALYN